MITDDVHEASGRRQMLEALRRELIGPSPAGSDLEIPQAGLHFATREDSYGPWHDSQTGEEILQRDPPMRRYGIGVLYPYREPPDPGDLLAASGGQAPQDEGLAGEAVESSRQRRTSGLSDSSDFDISMANSYKPSALGVSFLLSTTSAPSQLVATISGAAYEPVQVSIADARPEVWWVRRPNAVSVPIATSELTADEAKVIRRDLSPLWSGLSIGLEIYCRPWGEGRVLATVTLVNRTNAQPPRDARCLFQVEMALAIRGSARFDAYPARDASADPEVESFDLLYKDVPTYAVGHGCAADWSGPDTDRRLYARSLPTYETPSITPDIRLADGSEIKVPIAPLAGEDPDNDGMETLERVVDEYESWIVRKSAEADTLASEAHRLTAKKHLVLCTRAAKRMRVGLTLLKEDENASKAFQWMNAAMLDQQLRSARATRATSLVDGRFHVEGDVEPGGDRSGRSWRAFQVGFMLATLSSVADRNDPDRESVELIFFPTGGGKTEAYLGLAGFSMLLRRLRDSSDVGVQVLMRYTLRLLTTQQFTRAAALVCALDRQRKSHPELGGPFTIGVWLGGGTTPNREDDARAALRKLNKGDRKAENPFLLLRCPWCAAQFGPIEKAPPKGPKVAGYVESGGRVIFQCPDSRCAYGNADGLPVSVVDESIYKAPPDFLLGTVDKFAALAWRPEARALFGIGPSGERVASPPDLIIQDELHLISGPLGSVVGLYETAIEALCTDDRFDAPVKPKIITSTATIRRYEDQARSLYARTTVHLFPPHGLDAGDSFFAQYARNKDGTLSPGRMYVGIHAPGLGSIQTTQVRTFAAILQAAQDLPEGRRDPWWTLLSFFNSLRELGTSLTLLQSDIPDYLNVIRSRYGLDYEQIRTLTDRATKELTSRLRHDEIPQAIEDLQQTYESGKALDVCIASNIIEVGVDIDRLSVMTVLGQPKSTSQYIQVTGRVGRRWKERPGLIATIYGASKPRDRSHFEHFRSYHARLYAEVEPTSATPFSPPVLDRAAHAVLIALVRQLGPEDLKPWPFSEDLTTRALDLLRARVAEVDSIEADELDRVLKQRLHEWESWQRTQWSATSSDQDVPLLRAAGQWVPEEARALSWPTPNSMRDVDAECRVEVTSAYRRAAGAEAGQG